MRLYTINGRVFFEVSPDGKLPTSAEQNQHQILTIDRGQSVELCSGRFSVKPRLLWSDSTAVPGR